MAVRSFATNNLVKEHDLYTKFMKKRWAYISEEGGEPTEVLFCKKGLVSDILDLKFDEVNQNESTSKMCMAMNHIKKWHSIGIAYDIWCDLSRFYVDKKDHNGIAYKKFVDMPADILKKFKFRFEQSVKNAKCQYTRNNGTLVDPCRLLAMFWTYLELAKDCKTQRYFPNRVTSERAAVIFGYKKNEDPFKLNGTFMKNAIIKKEEKPVKETVCVTNSISNDTLLVDIIDDRRLTNPLWRAGIQTVGEFRSKTDKELLKIRTFGVSKLKHMREYLDKLAPEESVIDIAEEAAKRVEEEEKLAPNKEESKYEHVEFSYDFKDKEITPNKLRPEESVINISKNEYEEFMGLKKKYEELLNTAQKQADMYDELLKQKLELDACNARLKDDILMLKEQNEELKELNSNLKIAANPNNLDTFTLINTIIEKMKHSKMEYILLTIDGMTIDIHPKSSMNFPSNYKAYINNKREV